MRGSTVYKSLFSLPYQLIAVYSSSADESLKTFTSDVREQLLQGLADDADEIRCCICTCVITSLLNSAHCTCICCFRRIKMFDFWNQESRLASNTLSRLTQLLPVLYSTGTEKHFLYHSTNLLLELTSRSPDYNRSMFDQPLSECKFEVCGWLVSAWLWLCWSLCHTLNFSDGSFSSLSPVLPPSPHPLSPSLSGV